MGGVTHNGLEYTVRHQLRGELDAAGKLVAFRTCQPHYHMYVYSSSGDLHGIQPNSLLAGDRA